MIVTDGKGRGYKAEVDTNQRLYTLSDARSIIARESIQENSYVFYANHDIQAANTNEQLAFFKLNEDINLFISHIIFSSWATKAKFEMFFDTTYTSGGIARTPHNLNRNSSKTLDVTIYTNSSNDLTVSGISATTEFLDSRNANGSFLFDFKDSLLLGRNSSFSIQCETGAIGDKVRATVFYYKGS